MSSHTSMPSPVFDNRKSRELIRRGKYVEKWIRYGEGVYKKIGSCITGKFRSPSRIQDLHFVHTLIPFVSHIDEDSFIIISYPFPIHDKIEIIAAKVILTTYKDSVHATLGARKIKKLN
jgi:hypothetical protein